MSLRLALAVGLACAIAVVPAGSLAAQERDAPRFIIHGKGGMLPPAELQKLSAAWSLERAGNKDALAAADWVSLQQAGRARPAPLADNFILLGNGNRLPIKAGTPVRLQDDRFAFAPAAPLRCQAATELSLFRPYVALVLLSVPEGIDDVELLVARLQREPREHDIVLLRNGDRIEGAVSSLSEADGCAIVAEGQKIITPWPKLAGVAFATTNLARPRPKKLHAAAILAGGARVHFASLRFDAAQAQWAGRTTTGAEVTIPHSALVALDLLQGGAVYLSDLPPQDYKHTAYLGVNWPYRVDASVDGRPLRVGDDYFDKGIGLHGRCRLTYLLDGQYAWYTAVVGLDPSAGGKARARLAVLVDGKRLPLGADKELTADDPPLPVRVDVQGARTLTLVVDCGSLGDVQARVNWGGARLIKSKN